MGHVRLGTLRRTQTWNDVVARLRRGDSVREVAKGTLLAAEKGFRGASGDPGVVEAVWHLFQIPLAARTDSFETALYNSSIRVPGDCTLLSLIAAYSDSVDAWLENNARRTDLGELAQMAGAETLTAILADRTNSFFDLSPGDLQAELKELSQGKGVGFLMSRFFSRLTFKTLDYFLSRTMGNQVGPSCRFVSLDRLSKFTDSLEQVCDEAARYVPKYSSDWLSKTLFEHGEVSREKARDFVSGAMAKLIEELKQGAGLDGGGE